MLINGKFTTQIEASDRGLAYGDGLFSTIKIKNGIPQLLNLHIKRFKLGASSLFFPNIDWEILKDEIIYLSDTVKNKKEMTLKVILTRSFGGRGYSSKNCTSHTRILSLHDFPTFYSSWQTSGIRLIDAKIRLGINPALAGMKTLNRLEQVLLKNEIDNSSADEAVVCDSNGIVVEAISSNLFFYLNDRWCTASLESSGVKGVMRAQIIAIARFNGYRIDEISITPKELLNAKAICLTNSLMEIVPVKEYCDKIFDEKSLQYIKQLRVFLEKANFKCL